MDHVISNFENNNYKSELEVKVSLLEKQNFEIRAQLIDKMVIKINSKSYQFWAWISVGIEYTSLMQLVIVHCQRKYEV